MTTVKNSRFVVDTEWLTEHLDDPNLRVYDCTVHIIPDPPRTYTIESGREEFETAHVPGAGFLDLAGPLSDPSSSLHFTMPSTTQLEEALGVVGLGNEHTAVLYSRTHVMWATRVWWMLRAAGFDNASVLDGGFGAWRESGAPLSTDPSQYPPARFRAVPRPELWANRDDVLNAIDAPAVCTINALGADVHSGEGGMNYGRKGHIKGSVNVPFANLLEDGTFQSEDVLKSEFGKVGAFDRERVIVYCGGGISATTDALALVMAGHPNVAVYDGSMSEWVRDPDLPMELGK